MARQLTTSRPERGYTAQKHKLTYTKPDGSVGQYERLSAVVLPGSTRWLYQKLKKAVEAGELTVQKEPDPEQLRRVLSDLG